eukprot:scpid88380/ scgid12699/ 
MGRKDFLPCLHGESHCTARNVTRAMKPREWTCTVCSRRAAVEAILRREATIPLIYSYSCGWLSPILFTLSLAGVSTESCREENVLCTVGDSQVAEDFQSQLGAYRWSRRKRHDSQQQNSQYGEVVAQAVVQK